MSAGVTHADKPLLGVPIPLKDVLAVKGQPLSCGSKILGKFVAPYDATVVEKLRAAGAILFGRLNMDEFAMGSSTENSAFGPTVIRGTPRGFRVVPRAVRRRRWPPTNVLSRSAAIPAVPFGSRRPFAECGP
jgi:hypothetical protein